MLEHFEIVELEEKWQKYKDSNKKSTIDKINDRLNILKFDKFIIGLLIFISVAVGVIFWLLDDRSNTQNSTINIAENSNIDSKKIEDNTTLISVKQPIEVALNNSQVKTPENIKENTNAKRGNLSLNDIGVSSSSDAGGFNLNNLYESSQNESQKSIETSRSSFTAIPKDEIIDFGNPPSPPKRAASKPQAPRGKIEIKSTPIKVDKKSLEQRFYSTNNISFSLELAQMAYDSKNYDEAIKWALISNDIDKTSPRSWIIFAKATHKKGNTKDALFALENFNAKNPSSEVQGVINQIKNGAL